MPLRTRLRQDTSTKYLNVESVQQAIGVTHNYTNPMSFRVAAAISMSGDLARSSFLRGMEELQESGTRVALWYGDTGWASNWFGGELVAHGTNYTGAEAFQDVGYTPLIVDGEWYGDVKEAANFSFTRIFDAGHAIPYYQPEATLALFNRTITGYDTATGRERIILDFVTEGDARSTCSQIEEKTNLALKSAKFRV